MEFYQSVQRGKKEVQALKAGAIPDLLGVDLQSYAAKSAQTYFAHPENGCAGAGQGKPDKSSDEKELQQKEAAYVESKSSEVPPLSTEQYEVCSSDRTSRDIPEISDRVYDQSEGQGEARLTEKVSEKTPASSTKEYDEVEGETEEKSAPRIAGIETSYVPTPLHEGANPIGECSPQKSEFSLSGAYVDSPADVNSSDNIRKPIGTVSAEHILDESATKESFQSEMKSPAEYALGENAKLTKGEYLEGEAAKLPEDDIGQQAAREFETGTPDHNEAKDVIEGPCDTPPAKAGATDTPYAGQLDRVGKYDQVAYDYKPGESVEFKDAEAPCRGTAVEETENVQSESMVRETETELERSTAKAEVDEQAEAEYGKTEAFSERDAAGYAVKKNTIAEEQPVFEKDAAAEEKVAAKEETAAHSVQQEEADVIKKAEEEAAQEADRSAYTAQEPEAKAAAIVHDTGAAGGEQFIPKEPTTRAYDPEAAIYGKVATLKAEGNYEESKAMQEETIKEVPVPEKQPEAEGYREIKATGESVPAAYQPFDEVAEPEKAHVEQPIDEGAKQEKRSDEECTKETTEVTTPEERCEEKVYQEEVSAKAVTTTGETKPDNPCQEGIISEAFQGGEKDVPMTEVFQNKAFENIAEPAPPQKGSIFEKLMDKMTGKHK